MNKAYTIAGLDADQRKEVLYRNPGLLSRVAERTGKTVGNVSRVFHGEVKYSPDVQAALNEELARVLQPGA